MSSPISSLPLERYRTLQKEVESGDLHGTLISAAKVGLRRGASTKYRDRKITEAERDDIFLTVQHSPITEFKPLIYNIPWGEVEHLLERVPVLSTARPTSIEYIIRELPGSKFDILDYHGI